VTRAIRFLVDGGWWACGHRPTGCPASMMRVWPVYKVLTLTAHVRVLDVRRGPPPWHHQTVSSALGKTVSKSAARDRCRAAGDLG
jgi:hypothetical protein